MAAQFFCYSKHANLLTVKQGYEIGPWNHSCINVAFCQGFRGLGSFIELLSQVTGRRDHTSSGPARGPFTTQLRFLIFFFINLDFCFQIGVRQHTLNSYAHCLVKKKSKLGSVYKTVLGKSIF